MTELEKLREEKFLEVDAIFKRFAKITGNLNQDAAAQLTQAYYLALAVKELDTLSSVVHEK